MYSLKEKVFEQEECVTTKEYTIFIDKTLSYLEVNLWLKFYHDNNWKQGIAKRIVYDANGYHGGWDQSDVDLGQAVQTDRQNLQQEQWQAQGQLLGPRGARKDPFARQTNELDSWHLSADQLEFKEKSALQKAHSVDQSFVTLAPKNHAAERGTAFGWLVAAELLWQFPIPKLLLRRKTLID